MKLTELLKNVTPLTIVGDAEVDITGVNIDSRKVENGHLFVAIKGTQTDGHRFIPKAIELGAKAVLCEDLPDADAMGNNGVTYVLQRKMLWDRLLPCSMVSPRRN